MWVKYLMWYNGGWDLILDLEFDWIMKSGCWYYWLISFVLPTWPWFYVKYIRRQRNCVQQQTFFKNNNYISVYSVDNVLLIISARCRYVACPFKCSSSLKAGKIQIGCQYFHWGTAGKIILKVILMISLICAVIIIAVVLLCYALER